MPQFYNPNQAEVQTLRQQLWAIFTSIQLTNLALNPASLFLPQEFRIVYLANFKLLLLSGRKLKEIYSDLPQEINSKNVLCFYNSITEDLVNVSLVSDPINNFIIYFWSEKSKVIDLKELKRVIEANTNIKIDIDSLSERVEVLVTKLSDVVNVQATVSKSDDNQANLSFLNNSPIGKERRLVPIDLKGYVNQLNIQVQTLVNSGHKFISKFELNQIIPSEELAKVVLVFNEQNTEVKLVSSTLGVGYSILTTHNPIKLSSAEQIRMYTNEFYNLNLNSVLYHVCDVSLEEGQVEILKAKNTNGQEIETNYGNSTYTLAVIKFNNKQYPVLLTKIEIQKLIQGYATNNSWPITIKKLTYAINANPTIANQSEG